MKKSKSIWVCTIGILLSLCTSSLLAEIEMDKDVPIGWATVPNDTTENTIGGGNGEVVTVTSNAELLDYALRKEPYVIIANGKFSGMITVNNDKTIIGGGSGAFLKGGFFMHQKGDNVIIRNWEITGGNPNAPIPYMEDAVSISEVTHVWVDHCNLYSCTDGLIDITRASDMVTVSWVKMSKHHKVMLVQNGQEQFPGEWDRLNTTIHHTYYAGGDTRNPRIGFSDALILNCYWNGCGGYAIHLHWECKVLIERNYFQNVGDKVSVHRGGAGKKTPKWGRIWEGWAVLEDNIPKSGYGVKSQTDSSRIFNPDKVYMYDFIVDDVNSVPDIVSKGATTGAEWSKLGAIPTPGQGLVNTFKNPVLKWTKYGSKPTNKVYFGTTKNPPEVTTVDGYEFQPGMLEANTVYYWRINDGKLWKFRTGTEVDPNVPTAKLGRIVKKGSVLKPYIVNSGSGLMLSNPTESKLSFAVFTIKGQSVLPLTVVESGERLRLPSVSSPLYIKIRGSKVQADGYLYMPVK